MHTLETFIQTLMPSYGGYLSKIIQMLKNEKKKENVKIIFNHSIIHSTDREQDRVVGYFRQQSIYST